MRLIGFSTGALALGQFREALNMLNETDTKAVELSALRDHEVDPLMEALPDLDLRPYTYVSVHVPSSFKTLTEAEVAMRLRPCIDRGIAVVIHPDVIQDPACWKPFGSLLCIENMDKRKRTGRIADELEPFFTTFADATFCLDIAHARQVDSTMGEARQMLQRFGNRLRQVHMSEIDAQGHHHGVSLATILGCRSIAALIGENIPTIIESQIRRQEIMKEIAVVEQAFKQGILEATFVNADWGVLA